MRHIHADLIIAWANGAQIQFRYSTSDEWADSKNPSWSTHIQYRIKPEPKPDIVMYFEVRKPYGEILPNPFHNIKATYDGETGGLKSAEVIK